MREVQRKCYNLFKIEKDYNGGIWKGYVENVKSELNLGKCVGLSFVQMGVGIIERRYFVEKG